jgi:hypothetical protein
MDTLAADTVLTDAVERIENYAYAFHKFKPDVIAGQIRRDFGNLGDLVVALEARIAELSEAAKTRPDHTKLNRGIEIMRQVAQLLDPRGAQTELTDLAQKIRVCITKSDNLAITAGQHLRQARERCRAIGLQQVVRRGQSRD